MLSEIVHLNNCPIKISRYSRYLSLYMDSRLRWTVYLNYIKKRINKFTNILKQIAGFSWDISPMECINYVNAIIRAQVEWRSFWYVNSAGSYFAIIERLMGTAYKLAMGLPHFTPNRVVWKFSEQPPLSSDVYHTNMRQIYLQGFSTAKEWYSSSAQKFIFTLTMESCGPEKCSIFN